MSERGSFTQDATPPYSRQLCKTVYHEILTDDHDQMAQCIVSAWSTRKSAPKLDYAQNTWSSEGEKRSRLIDLKFGHEIVMDFKFDEAIIKLGTT